MPHYDYVCSSCHHEEEVFQKITDQVLEICPKCLANAFHRRPGRGGGILYRCTGFYETDYNSGKKPNSEPSSASKSSSSP